MPLHQTEELQAAPTSHIESEVLNERSETYEFPESKHDSQAVYETIHSQLVFDGNSLKIFRSSFGCAASMEICCAFEPSSSGRNE